MKRCYAGLAALAVLTLAPGPAHAQFGGGVYCINCATEVTQYSNFGQLVAEVAKMAQQVQIALNTYNQIMVAGRLLSNMQWSNISQDLMNVGAIVQVGQGLAFSAAQLDRAFTMAYPGWGPPPPNYYAGYQTWSTTLSQTIQGTLRGASLSYQQLLNDQLYASYLRSQTGNLQGELQAVTIGAQVGAATLGAIQKLQQLMMTDMQSKAAFQGYTLQRQVQGTSLEMQFFTPNSAGRDGIGW